jgi:O-antigen/teichoic acid export membrane protein
VSKTPSLLRNITWLGAANLVVKPIWFLFITAACMRVLGVEQYGVLTASLALAMIAASFIDVGMSRYTVRAVARDRSEAPFFLANFYSLRAVLGILASAIALIVAYPLGYRGTAFVAVGCAVVYAVSLNVSNYCRAFYQAFEDLRREALMLYLEKILVVGFGAACLFTWRSATATLAGMAGGMVLTSAAHFVMTTRSIAPFRPSLIEPTFIRAKFFEMLPFGAAGVLTVIYYRVDLVMVESMLGDLPAGQYGAAYRILEALNVLPAVIGLAALHPRMSRLQAARDWTGYRRVFRTGLLGLPAIAVVVAIGLSGFAESLIAVLSPDPSFGKSAETLRILVWTFPLICANLIVYLGLLTADDERFVALMLIAVVVFNIVANLFAIPALGVDGAAVTTVASEVLLLIIYALRYRSRSQVAFSAEPNV